MFSFDHVIHLVLHLKTKFLPSQYTSMHNGSLLKLGFYHQGFIIDFKSMRTKSSTMAARSKWTIHFLTILADLVVETLSNHLRHGPTQLFTILLPTDLHMIHNVHISCVVLLPMLSVFLPSSSSSLLFFFSQLPSHPPLDCLP